MTYEQSIANVTAAQTAYERGCDSCSTDDEIAALLALFREAKKAHIQQFGALWRVAGHWC